MRKFKKIVHTIIAVMICLTMFHVHNVNAGGISVSASPSSVEVGQQFTISVSASGVFVEGLSINCSGCTLISGINPTVDTGETKTATARLDSEGGASISVTGLAADYETETEYAVSGSAYVSAKKKQSTPQPNTNNGSSSNQSQNQTQPTTPKEDPVEDTRSMDNKLASLSLSQGKLSPEFSADTTSYKVELPADVEKVTINAKANDAKATVSGTGEKTLKAGKNEYTIKVTAENGSTKSYDIEINVDEKPLVYTTYNGMKLGVVRNIEDIDIPKGFKETKVKLEDKDVIAWTNEKTNKTIVYLSNESDDKSFYLYEDGKITSSFTYRKMLGREFFIIDVPQEKQKLNGLKYQKITIDETELNGWLFEDKSFENFAVIYVMDMDGNMQYYQYEKTQNTLQLYSGAAAATQKSYDDQTNELKSSHKLNTILIITSIALAVIVIACICYIVYFKRNSRRKGARMIGNMKRDEE